MGCHLDPNQMFNMIFGYNSQYADTDTVTSVGAADSLPTLTPIGAGEIVVVTYAAIRHNDPTARRLHLAYNIGGVSYEIATNPSVAQWQTLDRHVWIVLCEDNYLLGDCVSLLTGKDVTLWATGFKMKPSQ